VKKKQKKIQAVLLIIGVLLILLTYFYYPYINKNKSVVDQDIEKKIPSTLDDANKNATSFENLEYKGFYDFDKRYVIKSKKAAVNQDDPDIVFMEDMHVILYLKDGRIVNILSDMGKYNKKNYDIFFEKNVRATDGKTKIFSDNLDLLGNESAVKIYNNVSIDYPTGSLLLADKIDYDFENKNFKISMFDDKRIKMKIFNE